MIDADIECLLRLTCSVCKKRIKDVWAFHDKKSKDYLITYECHGEQDEFSIGGNVIDERLREGKMLLSTVFTDFGSGSENTHCWIDGPKSVQPKPVAPSDQLAELIWSKRDGDGV